MKRQWLFSLLIVLVGAALAQPANIDLQIVSEFSVNAKVGSLRSVPVQLSANEKAILLIYSADKDIDPWIEMFYPPTDKLKFALYTLDGKLIWKKELGAGTLNGVWFTPVYPFDLDQDGADEIYFVNNSDSIHLLSFRSLQLLALDSGTGEELGQWPWKNHCPNESLSHTFRQFIMGGYVKGEPVLITAQGTYKNMGLMAWNPGMEKRWELHIDADEPGARGSHMAPVVDINHDGIDEILWGERCIEMDQGKYLFIADKNLYNGHSDVVQPTINRENNEWSIFTCRETGDKGEIKPRVVMFDNKGQRLWTDLDQGHMDMGWTAQVDTDSLSVLAYTMSRGEKVAGPEGFFRMDVKVYTYNGETGERIQLPFSAYNTLPADLDGDGYHEFICAIGEQADRNVYDLSGKVLKSLGEGAYVAMGSKFMNLPGEQILCYHADGTIKIWADKNAVDSKTANKRYSNPYYKSAQQLTAVGYNLVNLGGL